MATPEINKPLYRNINGEKVKINPLTKSSCVIMEDGRTVEEVVNELRQLITLIEQYGLYKFDEPKEQPQDKPKEQPQTTTTFEPYMVRIICDSLTIRKEASFNSDPVGYVHRGEAFTIVGEANGLLKLKSGKGWISANNKYVQKI